MTMTVETEVMNLIASMERVIAPCLLVEMASVFHFHTLVIKIKIVVMAVMRIVHCVVRLFPITLNKYNFIILSF